MPLQVTAQLSLHIRQWLILVDEFASSIYFTVRTTTYFYIVAYNSSFASDWKLLELFSKFR